MTQITGGCLGGAARYSTDVEPVPGRTSAYVETATGAGWTIGMMPSAPEW